jgi:hypothetical protein
LKNYRKKNYLLKQEKKCNKVFYKKNSLYQKKKAWHQGGLLIVLWLGQFEWR